MSKVCVREKPQVTEVSANAIGKPSQLHEVFHIYVEIYVNHERIVLCVGPLKILAMFLPTCILTWLLLNIVKTVITQWQC